MATESMLITGIRVYAEKGTINEGYVTIQNGKILEIGQMADLKDTDGYDQLFSFPDSYALLPGMIDLHIHGANGADTMDATPEAVRTMAKWLPHEGTTSFLATTMTQEVEQIERALVNVADYRKRANGPGEAEILGVHLEGPFLSPRRAGAQPVDKMINPDIVLFEKWQRIAAGAIRLVTVAPELPGGMEFVSHLAQCDVVASIGHSDATYAEVAEGVRCGLKHVTHLFNGMRGLHHREPGVVGAALLHPELLAELIVDGMHVHPEMVKLVYQQKGRSGLILITDAMRAKCLGEGTYELGGQEVIVQNGRALLADGTLAGSIVKMKDAATNAMRFSGCTLEDIVHMTAVNPAKQLGLFASKGSIAQGKDADLVVLDKEHEVVLTLCRGKIAFHAR
ncbi:N-acetylglucosamine-6-phosphate deacetylase [Aneurinibacillus aneurinilyticus]|uniref:N-acetylglucosamine-6-phosphate deacetylase n=2 Tax=Aneurinibacillus aneurinilyticus TaxID=1391 RepID=U1WBP6_ANEAE|nr:N-acetylglucosamine-6-phosphate deacetylase [Aneurinibacillus aneurinilyticus]ERI05964.1 N-acetylglucosamine-6-phosphate deacetylase [Aneurinibacillus aneurinilyticus ATCC 12856]MED0708524.1 N-acetylglucosamine-6-phosphate deacetylase [Aneurinibacillus aneurinilyticus]MED0721684.1 N-acetylglucosamine-6-phosphate deacetylase [Aneurinibacillus aneurinilyticus]MED0731808.1 N-acetylglucosamine-6-phosphate deacetylase [Aneurinibacillus aneurinilyticus]MED0740611.1 N-acetylglucosamine-6-phosphate